MKAFIVVSCLILTATAKPQGYNYEKPNNNGLSVTLVLPSAQNQHISSSFPKISSGHTSFQGYAPAVSHQSLGVNSHSSGGSLSLGSSYSVSPHSSGGQSSHSFGSGSLSSFGSGSTSGHSFGSGDSSSFGSGLTSGHSFGSGDLSSFGSGSSSGHSFGSGDSSSLGSGLSSGHSFGSGISSSPSSGSSFSASAPSYAPSPVASVAPVANTLVQRHIYVHVPPPDEEELHPKNNVVAPVQAQKHYKIIFIKAPSGPSIAQQMAQLAQPQSEEKTLVYVLVKKPDSLEDIQNIMARAPVQQPTKPEVYFIKYKTETGASSVPASAPIGLSAPSTSAQTLQLPQSSSFGSTSSEVASSGIDSTASSFSSSSSGGDTSSNALSSSNAANIGDVIQPRTPAPEYGPPKH